MGICVELDVLVFLVEVPHVLSPTLSRNGLSSLDKRTSTHPDWRAQSPHLSPCKECIGEENTKRNCHMCQHSLYLLQNLAHICYWKPYKLSIQLRLWRHVMAGQT